MDLGDRLAAQTDPPAVPASPEEALAVIDAFRARGEAAREAQQWKDGLDRFPHLGRDSRARYRILAARAALRAAAGNDARRAPPEEQASWRTWALALMAAELNAGYAAWDDGKLSKPGLAAILDAWLGDPGFAGVRDFGALAALPESERHGWVDFWSRIARMRIDLQ